MSNLNPSPTGDPGDLDSVMTELELSDDAKAKIKAASKGSKVRRLDASAIEAAYSHVVPGSLQFDGGATKQSVLIRCTTRKCKETRRVFTSDLFQVRVCTEHRKSQRKAARQASRKARKASESTAS